MVLVGFIDNTSYSSFGKEPYESRVFLQQRPDVGSPGDMCAFALRTRRACAYCIIHFMQYAHFMNNVQHVCTNMCIHNNNRIHIFTAIVYNVCMRNAMYA